MSTTINDSGTKDGGGRRRRSRARLALLGVGLAAAGTGFATLAAAPAFAQGPTAAAVAVHREPTDEPASRDVHETRAVVQRERAGHERSIQDRSTKDLTTHGRQGVQASQDG